MGNQIDKSSNQIHSDNLQKFTLSKPSKDVTPPLRTVEDNTHREEINNQIERTENDS